MFLYDYIHGQADTTNERCDICAALFDVEPRTVRSWYYFERHPTVEAARHIVRVTDGVVDYEGIYAPYEKV